MCFGICYTLQIFVSLSASGFTVNDKMRKVFTFRNPFNFKLKTKKIPDLSGQVYSTSKVFVNLLETLFQCVQQYLAMSQSQTVFFLTFYNHGRNFFETTNNNNSSKLLIMQWSVNPVDITYSHNHSGLWFFK